MLFCMNAIRVHFTQQGQNTDETWLNLQRPPHQFPCDNVCFSAVKATPAMGVLVPESICLSESDLLPLLFFFGHYTVVSVALYPPLVPPPLLSVAPWLPPLSPCYLCNLLRSFFTLACNQGHLLSPCVSAGRLSLSTTAGRKRQPLISTAEKGTRSCIRLVNLKQNTLTQEDRNRVMLLNHIVLIGE